MNSEPSDSRDNKQICSRCDRQLSECTCDTVLAPPQAETERLNATSPGTGPYDEGTVLDGRYELVRAIGTGGMGTVYEARHIVLEHRVAIKVLRAEFLTDSQALSRFEMEARACAALSHPNLVSVFDCGTTEEGEPFLVMEFLEGDNLFDLTKGRKALSPDRFFEIFISVVKALSYAHSEGVIHRDLKTENIVVIDGPENLKVPKIVDFGIAKIEDLGNQVQMLTQTGEIFGSPSYMSPEQCVGKSVDSRSDIYSLGCVMYEAITGKQAFAGANMMDILEKQLKEEPKAPASIAALQVDERLSDCIMRCLEKEPDRRIQTCDELLEQLISAREQNFGAYTVSIGPLRLPAGVLLSSLVVVALGAFLLYFWSLASQGLLDDLTGRRSAASEDFARVASALAIAEYANDRDRKEEARKILVSSCARTKKPTTLAPFAFLLLKHYTDSKNTDEAIKLFESVEPYITPLSKDRGVKLTSYQADSVALLYHYAAKALKKKGDIMNNKVETMYRRGIKVSANNNGSPWIEALLRKDLGRLLRDEHKNRSKEALDQFSQAIQLLLREDKSRPVRHKDLAMAYMEKCWTYQRTGKFTLAAKEIENALEAASKRDDPDQRAYLVEEKMKNLEHMEQFEKAYSEADKLRALKAPAYSAGSKIEREIVSLDTALFVYTESLFGWEPFIDRLLDQSLQARDDLDAVAFASIKMRMMNGWSQFDSTVSLFEKIEPALKRLIKAHKMKSHSLGTSALVYYLAAVAKLELKDYSGCKKLIKEGMSRTSGHPEKTWVEAMLYRQLARAEMEQGNLSKAEKAANLALQRVRARAGDDHLTLSETYLLRAKIHESQKRWREARADLEAAIGAIEKKGYWKSHCDRYRQELERMESRQAD